MQMLAALSLVALVSLVAGAGLEGKDYADSMIADRGECTYSCEGDEPEMTWSLQTPPDDSASCWGEFKMFCRKKETADPLVAGTNFTASFSGYGCKGHMVWAIRGKDTVDTKEFVMCEGGSKSIRGRIGTCPHTGQTYKMMNGWWSLGSSALGMERSKEQEGGIPSELDPAASSIQAVLDSEPLMQKVRAALEEEDGQETLGMIKVKVESRSEGLSGEWKATKKVKSGVELALSAEEWEADEAGVLHPSWLSWFKSLATPPPAREHEHTDFKLLCNDKVAWWHGAAPCWGNFTFAASDSAETRSSATRRSARRLAMKGEEAQAIRGSGITEAAEEEEESEEMRVECDGLYTGLFMGCHGLQTAHIEKEWSTGSFDKFGICTGLQKVKFIHGADVWGMGTMCHGRSVVGIHVLAVVEGKKKK